MRLMVLALVLVAGVCATCAGRQSARATVQERGASESTVVPFEHVIVDAQACGHRAVADVDGDVDIVGVRNYNRPPIELWMNVTADQELSAP